jgi:hypothetical protein
VRRSNELAAKQAGEILMAEFQFYARKSEWWKLLQSVLKPGDLRFAADRWYESAKCEYYDKIDEHAKAAILDGKPRVFLIPKGAGSLRLGKQDAGPRGGQYYVDFARGEPSIEFRLPSEYEESGVIRLVPGGIAYQRKYDTDDRSDAFSPTSDFVAVFARVRDVLKENLARVNATKPIWLSPAAQQLLSRGKGALLIRGRWVNQLPWLSR